MSERRLPKRHYHNEITTVFRGEVRRSRYVPAHHGQRRHEIRKAVAIKYLMRECHLTRAEAEEQFELGRY